MNPAPPVTSTLTIIVLCPASGSPPNPDFRIVAQHEAVGRWLHREPEYPHVLPDQAVLDACSEIGDAAAFEHDAVLDFRVAHLSIAHDRSKWPDIGVDDFRTSADDDGTAYHRVLDDGAGFDDHLALDSRLDIDGAIDAPLNRVENQPIRFEHVLEFAGILPPAVDDVRPHFQAAVDQVLDGIRDLQLVAEAGADGPDGLEHGRREHVDANQGKIAFRLRRLFNQPDDPAVRQFRYAEHLWIRHAREQDLRHRLFADELLHEVRDALVEQVVSEVHDERFVADERFADEHGVRE